MSKEVIIWIDYAEVLQRGRERDIGHSMNNHMVLDYDMWRLQSILQEKLTIPLRWEKVDSHIEGMLYKEGQQPHGDELSIRLNTVMVKWAEHARETVARIYTNTRNPQVCYEESQVTVNLKYGGMIYGDIEKRPTFFINKDKMVEYLMSKHKHWNKEIFDMIEWKAIESSLREIKDTEVINVIKMVHA